MNSRLTPSRLPEPEEYYDNSEDEVLASHVVIVSFTGPHDMDLVVSDDPDLCQAAYNDVYNMGPRICDLRIGNQQYAILDIVEVDDGDQLLDTIGEMMGEYSSDFSFDDYTILDGMEKIVRRKMGDVFADNTGGVLPLDSIILIGVIPV